MPHDFFHQAGVEARVSRETVFFQCRNFLGVVQHQPLKLDLQVQADRTVHG